MEKEIRLNEIQQHFLRCCIDLQNCVIDFEDDPKEFKKSFGFTIEEIKFEIEELRKQLEWK